MMALFFWWFLLFETGTNFESTQGNQLPTQQCRIWNSGDGSLVQCLEGPSKARQSRFDGSTAHVDQNLQEVEWILWHPKGALPSSFKYLGLL